MLLYLKQAIERGGGNLLAAIDEGAVQRVRPKAPAARSCSESPRR
jgi:Cu/Ag efflux pump CusA